MDPTVRAKTQQIEDIVKRNFHAPTAEQEKDAYLANLKEQLDKSKSSQYDTPDSIIQEKRRELQNLQDRYSDAARQRYYELKNYVEKNRDAPDIDQRIQDFKDYCEMNNIVARLRSMPVKPKKQLFDEKTPYKYPSSTPGSTRNEPTYGGRSITVIPDKTLESSPITIMADEHPIQIYVHPSNQDDDTNPYNPTTNPTYTNRAQPTRSTPIYDVSPIKTTPLLSTPPSSNNAPRVPYQPNPSLNSLHTPTYNDTPKAYTFIDTPSFPGPKLTRPSYHDTPKVDNTKEPNNTTTKPSYDETPKHARVPSPSFPFQSFKPSRLSYPEPDTVTPRQPHKPADVESPKKSEPNAVSSETSPSANQQSPSAKPIESSLDSEKTPSPQRINGRTEGYDKPPDKTPSNPNGLDKTDMPVTGTGQQQDKNSPKSPIQDENNKPGKSVNSTPKDKPPKSPIQDENNKTGKSVNSTPKDKSPKSPIQDANNVENKPLKPTTPGTVENTPKESNKPSDSISPSKTEPEKNTEKPGSGPGNGSTAENPPNSTDNVPPKEINNPAKEPSNLPITSTPKPPEKPERKNSSINDDFGKMYPIFITETRDVSNSSGRIVEYSIDSITTSENPSSQSSNKNWEERKNKLVTTYKSLRDTENNDNEGVNQQANTNAFDLYQFDRQKFSRIFFEEDAAPNDSLASSTARNELVLYHSTLNVLILLRHENKKDYCERLYLQWTNNPNIKVSDVTYCEANDRFLISTLKPSHVYVFNREICSLYDLGLFSQNSSLNRIHCYKDRIYGIFDNRHLLEFKLIENCSQAKFTQRIELTEADNPSEKRDYKLYDITCDEDYLAIVYGNENDEIRLKCRNCTTEKFDFDIVLDKCQPSEDLCARIESARSPGTYIYVIKGKNGLKSIDLKSKEPPVKSEIKENREPSNVCFLHDNRLVILHGKPYHLSVHDKNAP